MARFILEDLENSIEVFVFPKTMEEFGALLENDVIVIINGRADANEDSPKIVAINLSRPKLEIEANTKLQISIPAEEIKENTVENLRKIILASPGASPVSIFLGERHLKLPPEYNCNVPLVSLEIRRLLGPESILEN